MDTLLRCCIASIVVCLLSFAAPVVAQLEPQDGDEDGYGDDIDSCPQIYNPAQSEDCTDEPLQGFATAAEPEPLSPTAPVVLYDVDFATPPHTVGQLPTVGGGPAPRDTPTRVNFGLPTVLEAVGAMDDQPLYFGSGSFPYDQVQFGLGNKFGDGGYDVQFPDYHFEMTVMRTSASGVLSIFYDGPMAHSVKFWGDGEIRAVTLGARAYNVNIGHWEPGVPMRLVVDIDRPTETWTIRLDGEVAFSGDYPIRPGFPMRLLRPSSSGVDIAAIDDVVVSSGLFVDVDIKPFRHTNLVDPMSPFPLFVAILGSEDLDVDDVDTATLAFGPGGTAPLDNLGDFYWDVNGDGLTDVVSSYRAADADIAFDDSSACLTGEKLDGTRFAGCDGIAIVHSCGLGFELTLLMPPLMWLHRRRRGKRGEGR